MRVLTLFATAMMLVACQTTTPTIQRTWELPAGVKTAAVNGYEMAYVERGTGIPVIFVHGLGVDYRHFSAQMEPFSARYRAIAVSLRRHYPEPWRGQGEFGLEQQAEDLVAFIRGLGAGPVHLVGHSLGGTIALYATRMAPESVRTLTLAEGGGSMAAFSADDPEDGGRAAAFQAMSQKLSEGDTDGALEAFMTFVGGPGAWKSTPEASRQILRENAWTFLAHEGDRSRWPAFSCDDAKRLDVPVLLLGAEKSPPRFGEILNKLQACLPRSERGQVANSGHPMARVNPTGFNSAVMTFISAH
jgi:esterase